MNATAGSSTTYLRGPTERPAPAFQLAQEVRILILDDDVAVCRVIAGALSGQGYNIRVASEPSRMEVALRADPQKPFHLIVMDYVLPGLEPEQVFGWIHDWQPEASIIVVTGFPSIDSALNCLRARTYDYITKPFGVAQIRQVVTRCLAGKGLLRMSEEALRDSLGGAIRDLRKAQKLTLSELATKAEVSLGYLSQIELGKNSPSIEMLYRICLALNIKLPDLFTTVQREV